MSPARKNEEDESPRTRLTCVARSLEDGATLVTAAGDLDINTCGEFQRVVSGARRDAQLIIDLSDVTFMDSSGLGVLVCLQRETGTPLDIVVSNEHLRKLLFITGLNTVFTLHRSLPEARGRAA